MTRETHRPEVGERWRNRSEIREVTGVEINPRDARRYLVHVRIEWDDGAGIKIDVMTGFQWSNWLMTRKAWLEERRHANP